MKKIALFSSVFLFTGCTTLSTKVSFDLIKGTVSERTGQHVFWNQGTAEDAEVQKRVNELLQGTLTLDKALEVSLMNNPKLQAKYEELGIAQSELVQAGLFENPVVSIERRFRGRAAEVDVAQNFLSILLIPLRTKAAKAGLTAVTQRITQEVLDHAAEVKSAFYSLQGEQQSLEMREAVVRSLEASYGAARALYEAGNRAILEVQNEATLLAQAKVELAQASVRVLEERERLNVLLGAWGQNTKWTISKRLPDLPSEEVSLPGIESYAINHRLDFAAAKSELEAIATQAGIAQYEALIPSLSLGGHFEREPEGSSTRGPSFEFPLPLFNWGRAASVQGNALFRQALRRYEALAIDTRSKVRVAYGRMKAARARAEYFHEEVLPLQRRTLEQTQLFYNGMFFGVFQLLQAKQAQITAGQSYIETLKEYWLARTDLEQTVGGTLRGIETTKELPLSAEVLPMEQKSSGGHGHHHH